MYKARTKAKTFLYFSKQEGLAGERYYAFGFGRYLPRIFYILIRRR